ncbi:MAG: PhoH family protein [Crocinitomicaceae bacterium]|nr:PhoH family protein [Crocinitomicaceae bacterium]
MAPSKRKIFVLDTSVLLHDHQSLLNFQNNDIVIPITVLEELDNFKVGNDTKNFSAREVTRFIDKLSENDSLKDWIPLGIKKGSLKVDMLQKPKNTNASAVFDNDKNDHKILNSALYIAEQFPRRQVVLVTKDINLRVKAKSLGLIAQDYQTGKVDQQSLEKLSSGRINDISSEVIQQLFKKNKLPENGLLGQEKRNNAYYVLKNGQSSILAHYNPFLDQIEKVEKGYNFGVKPKNAEQAFAAHALMNEAVRLVVLQGVAGTGKTLLALAAAIEQHQKFDQIILARPLVPLSNKEIGFLPGDAKEKISPYMEPLWDNLKFIKSQFGANEKKYKVIEQLQEEGKITIAPLAFIRGRSLSNTMFIIDEAQNLTPHEVKTIITRAGEGTKVVFTGDVHQIDNPYLDQNSNGLAYLIDRLNGQQLFSHIKLERGERSELANLANELL